jgi:hypothetical protein
MNFKQKVAIFLVAVVLTLVGFNLIAAPTIDILKVGKQAGYQIISNYLAKTEAAAHRPLIKG